MPLQSGDKLGPYEIISLIGKGGMGEVYRARDTTLKRDVALKVLPAVFLRDRDRMARFQREAEVLASLDHPNIGPIYGLVASQDSRALVLALIEGPTLADRIKAGRLPQDEAIAIAKQIIEALEYAHERGVVHRDLKPANVKITHEGVVKVLDFGLAKVLEDEPPPASALSDSPTLTTGLTGTGVILGTAAYMSPEQAVGRPVDRRSDIFSFGAVLYEMLTANRAFTGTTMPDLLEALVKNDPDWLALTADTPRYLRKLLERMLVKDRKQRLQAIGEARIVLGNPSALDAGNSGLLAGETAPSPSRLTKLWPIVAALLALLLIALAVGGDPWLTRALEAETWSGSVLGGPENALDPRISPDGRLLAFQVMERGQMQVAVMTPESGNWSILTHNRELGFPDEITWSRDGTSLYYDRVADVPRGIFSVPVLGGEEKLVLENAMAPEILRDGTLLIYRLNAQRNLQLFRYWPENGRLQDLPVICHAGPASLGVHIRATPDGREAVVAGTPLGQEKEPDRLLAVDVGTGASRALTPPGVTLEGNAVAVADNGKSVVVALREDALRRVVSIPMRGPLTGKFAPRTLVTTTSVIWYLDTDSDGRVYISATDQNSEAVRYSPAGTGAEVIAGLSGSQDNGIISLADGRGIATTRGLARDRLMAFADGKNPSPLVATTEQTSGPMTAAGPRGIAFMIGPAPHTAIAVAETATGRITSRIAPGKGQIRAIASSPDGKTLYFSAGGKIWSVPSAGGEPGPIRAGDGVAADPGGRSLVIGTTESTKVRLFRFPLDGSAEHEITTDGSVPLVPNSLCSLRADGRLLVILAPPDSWFFVPGILDTNTGRITRLPTAQASNTNALSWTADGEILELRERFRSTLWRFQPVAK